MREKTMRRIVIWVPILVVLLGFAVVAVIAWTIY